MYKLGEVTPAERYALIQALGVRKSWLEAQMPALRENGMARVIRYREMQLSAVNTLLARWRYSESDPAPRFDVVETHKP